MPLVWTEKGPIERERLEVKDIVVETDNSRDKITEWYLDGELVRRDGWVTVLMPATVTVEQGGFGSNVHGGSVSVGLKGIGMGASQAKFG